MHEAPVRCRICESACGLLAEVDAGRVVALRPDSEHPVSRGYACRKGHGFAAIQNHPSRLLHPLVRDHQGTLTRQPWGVVLTRAGARLSAIREEHGPGSVGLFVGNAAAHSLGTVLGATALQRALRTPKNYSSLSLDNSEMFVVFEEVLGNPMSTFVADYEHTDLLVLIGTDPVASQPSQVQSQPGAVGAIVGHGREGRLVVIDPRTSDTARRTEAHLRPRPGTDADLLGHLVLRALSSPGHRERAANDPLIRAGALDALALAVAPYTLELTARATGLTEAEIGGLADRLLAASRPLVWSGLGVLLGPDGTVGYWLTLCLQALLGGIDREGGWLQQRGAVDVASLFGRLGIPGRDQRLRSRIGDYPAVLGAVAAATLADDILTPGPDQLRALVVIGGNPAISLPDTPRALQALRSLDTLVCVDLFVNDTGSLADTVLPAATWLERDECAVHSANQSLRPHLELSRAVVAPHGEAREDFRILIDLARACGLPPFGSAAADLGLRATGIGPLGIARAASLFSRVSWGALTRASRGIQTPNSALGTLRRRGTDHADRALHLAVPEFIAALGARRPLAPPVAAGRALQLVTSVRPVETMNTWMHTGVGARRVPVARLHPEDAAALGPADGGTLVLWREDAPEASRIELPFVRDEGVRPGVVVVPWAWGHLPGGIGAGHDGPAGVNANMLVSTARLEPFTGQPLSNGQWVLAEVRS